MIEAPDTGASISELPDPASSANSVVFPPPISVNCSQPASLASLASDHYFRSETSHMGTESICGEAALSSEFPILSWVSNSQYLDRRLTSAPVNSDFLLPSAPVDANSVYYSGLTSLPDNQPRVNFENHSTCKMPLSTSVCPSEIMAGPNHTASLRGDWVSPPSVTKDVPLLFDSAAEEEQSPESVPNDSFFNEAFNAYTFAESSESMKAGVEDAHLLERAFSAYDTTMHSLR